VAYSQRIAYSIGIDVGVLDLRGDEAAVKQMILDEAKRGNRTLWDRSHFIRMRQNGWICKGIRM